MAERQSARETTDVACFRWSIRYLVGKEVLWAVYFVGHRSWSALAGVGLFLAYTPWHRWWCRRHPMREIA